MLRSVLVLTGAGRAFCAGQDLSDRAVTPGQQAADLGESIERYYAPLVRRLRDMPKPVIAAVNGVAAGAGANLALACDLVIAARSARFVQAFSKIGLLPDSGGSYWSPRLLGSARLGAGAAGRTPVGRTGGAMGADLALRRRCGVPGRGPATGRGAGRRADAGLCAHQAGLAGGGAQQPGTATAAGARLAA